MLKPIYILNRGYLNAIAVYSLGMFSALLAMLYFRRANKFKTSEMREYFSNFKKMKSNGFWTIFISASLTTFSCYTIFWNTFPDYIAVFNPFKGKLGLRNIDYLQSFLIFSLSIALIIILIINSLHFTGPASHSFRRLEEFSKVSFSLNILKTQYFARHATIVPILAFFVVIVVAFHYGNAFGVSLTYLGCVVFSQIIQFFQNFKNIYYFHLSILMSTKPKPELESKGLDDNFTEVMHFCRYFGKFSTGVSLFVHKIMCFTILLDSFNMHIVDHINLIEPYSLVSIMFGCLAIQVFISLDHVCAVRFVQFFMHRIHNITVVEMEDPSFQPDVDTINDDLLQVSFISEFMVLFLPVSC